MQGLPVKGHRLFGKFQVRHAVADPRREPVKSALQPRGIQILDLDGAGHLLVHAGRGEHDMRADLADVGLGGLRCFGEVQRVTHLKAAGDRHHLPPIQANGR
jgi:hypothetical protein